jgi:YVTN family beta-propeller protein
LLAAYSRNDADHDTDSGVALIDMAPSTTPPTRLATGPGIHDIAFDAPGRIAYVSNADANTVSVIDMTAQTIAGTVPTGRRPVILAYSALARKAYVAAQDGTITAISAAPAATANIAGPDGIMALRFAPGGRFALAASPQAGEVVVIDAATDRIVQRFAVAGEPDAIAFTEHIAYVRHGANEFIEAFPLEQIGIEGQTPTAINVAAGRLALGAISAPARADSMVALPEGDGLMIANPGDRQIYYYREGMAAPSGSLSTYGREPRAVTVIDHRLREAELGTYRSVGRLPRAGSYILVVSIEAPRLTQCLEVRVEPDPSAIEPQHPRLTIADMAVTKTVRAGVPALLQFRLLDSETGAPVSDVHDARVRSFLIPGNALALNPARPLGDGAYAAEVTLPSAGNYYVFVEAPSAALAPAAGRLISVAPAPRP